jgi:GcrA cell cycle regulator
MTYEAHMSWTDERVEQLRLHWVEGKSASQIAALLGHGLTRNAVIGKVHRLGLATRAKSPGSASPRPRPPRPTPSVHRSAAPRPSTVVPRIGRGATALAIAPQAFADADAQDFESVVVPMSLRVTIVELREAMCRWPLGDPSSPDFRYCGSHTATGPYCPHHGALAYQPAQDRRRERDRERRAGLLR